MRNLHIKEVEIFIIRMGRNFFNSHKLSFLKICRLMIIANLLKWNKDKLYHVIINTYLGNSKIIRENFEVLAKFMQPLKSNNFTKTHKSDENVQKILKN